MRYTKKIVFLLCCSVVILSALAFYYKRGWDTVDGQLREISNDVDSINMIMHDLGGLYGRTRSGIILTQLHSQDENLIVMFGDSIVEQMYFPETAGYNVINSGVSGARALESLPFLQKVLAASHGPAVVLSIGANDALGDKVATPEDFAAGYEALAKAVRQSGRALVLVTLPPMEPEKFTAVKFDYTRVADYNAAIREVGRRTGAVVAEVHDAIDAWRKGRPGGFTVDGVHLGAQAAALWRQIVYAAVARALPANAQ